MKMSLSLVPGVLLTAGLCLPIGAGLGQWNSSVQDESDPSVGWRQRQQQQHDELVTALQGSWNLIEFRHITNDLAGIGVAGFLNITEDLLTFIVHTSDPGEGFFGDPRRFQAGVHYWRVSDDLYLQTSSVLSHTNFEGGDVQFEPQLTPREYQPVVGDLELSLVRSDGSVLRFQRLAPQPFPERAIRALEAARSGLDPYEQR